MTVYDVHTALHLLLDAVGEGVLARSPCDGRAAQFGFELALQMLFAHPEYTMALAQAEQALMATQPGLGESAEKLLAVLTTAFPLEAVR